MTDLSNMPVDKHFLYVRNLEDSVRMFEGEFDEIGHQYIYLRKEVWRNIFVFDFFSNWEETIAESIDVRKVEKND